MTKEEIIKIKESVANDDKEPINLKEDDAIYILSESEGWRILMKKANRTIVKLLEPIDSSQVSDSAKLALIGANTLANAKALKVLREFINQVETVKNAKRAILKKQEEEKEESKKGAQ